MNSRRGVHTTRGSVRVIDRVPTNEDESDVDLEEYSGSSLGSSHAWISPTP